MSIPIGPRLLHVSLFCAIFFFSSTAMRQSSVPPAVARSILVTVCSPHGGDVVSYGAGRVTDARRRSQVCELAAADDRAVNRRQYAWLFKCTGNTPVGLILSGRPLLTARLPRPAAHGPRQQPQTHSRRPCCGRQRRPQGAANGLSADRDEAFCCLPAYLRRAQRGRGCVAGGLHDGLA